MISFLQFDGSCTVLGMAFDFSSSLIILIAIIFLMLIWKAVSSLFSESKIPSPKGNWLLGHLFELRKSKDVMQTFAEWEKTYGPIVEFRPLGIFGKPPDIVQIYLALSSDSIRIHKFYDEGIIFAKISKIHAGSSKI